MTTTHPFVCSIAHAQLLAKEAAEMNGHFLSDGWRTVPTTVFHPITSTTECICCEAHVTVTPSHVEGNGFDWYGPALQRECPEVAEGDGPQE